MWQIQEAIHLCIHAFFYSDELNNRKSSEIKDKEDHLLFFLSVLYEYLEVVNYYVTCRCFCFGKIFCYITDKADHHKSYFNIDRWVFEMKRSNKTDILFETMVHPHSKLSRHTCACNRSYSHHTPLSSLDVSPVPELFANCKMIFFLLTARHMRIFLSC